MARIADRRRPGFALPATLAFAGVLAVAAVTAFTPADTGLDEQRAAQRALDAYALAQGGLERFLAERASLVGTGAPASDEAVRIDGAAGFADITLSRVRPTVGGTPALFLVRSVGTVPGARGPLAQHTVSQLARWRAGTLALAAAWTTMRVEAPITSRVDGADRCGAATARAAVASAPDFAGLDWRGLVEGTALARGAARQASELPRYSTPEAWPIIRHDGDHDLAVSGQGTLIVTGDLRISGGHEWRGLILAGGRVALMRGARVHGAVVTGLNERLGVAPTAPDVIDARARVRFDSCDLTRATDAFGTLELVPNTWVDG
jgi:hypothetical protein